MDSIHFECSELGKWAGLSLIYRTPKICFLIAQCEGERRGPGAEEVYESVSKCVADRNTRRCMIIEMSRNSTMSIW